MGLIGVHPDNLISPIDFIPGVGPAIKIAKGVRFINKARKTRKRGGIISYINAVEDDVRGLGHLAGGYLLARATTVPLIAPAIKHQREIRLYAPGSTASQKADYWYDYFS